jgi:hypothetical protein
MTTFTRICNEIFEKVWRAGKWNITNLVDKIFSLCDGAILIAFGMG